MIVRKFLSKTVSLLSSKEVVYLWGKEYKNIHKQRFDFFLGLIVNFMISIMYRRENGKSRIK